MARLNFDFHAQPARPGKLGIALVLAGLVALGWAWSNLLAARANHDNASAQLAALEQAAQKRKQPRATARSAMRADDAAQTAQARIAAQLDYSWQPAFEALAAARSNKIALLSLDAIQAKSQLKLVAEARKLADAISFIEALQQQPGVKRATLIQHEMQTGSAQNPVRFNILVEMGA